MLTGSYSSVPSRQRDKLFLAAAAMALALYFAFQFTYFAAGAEKIRTDVVRLHVLAESDDASDQKVKLAVRDALLKTDTALLSSGVTVQNAEAAYEASQKTLETTADRVLRENGKSYRAKVIFCHELYPTRVYGDLTFPSGVYTSVKVILGSGKGHNWWCVLFPPLCVSAASGGDVKVDKNVDLEAYVSRDGKKILTSGRKYKAEFKVLEWYEKLHEKISEQK